MFLAFNTGLTMVRHVCSHGRPIKKPFDVQTHLVPACMSKLLMSEGKAMGSVLQGQTQLADAVTQDIQPATAQQSLVPVIPFAQFISRCSGRGEGLVSLHCFSQLYPRITTYNLVNTYFHIPTVCASSLCITIYLDTLRSTNILNC